ncbi:hypothetical protein SARC_14808, partial [Sphaeroforma arctica JP610]
MRVKATNAGPTPGSTHNIHAQSRGKSPRVVIVRSKSTIAHNTNKRSSLSQPQQKQTITKENYDNNCTIDIYEKNEDGAGTGADKDVSEEIDLNAETGKQLKNKETHTTVEAEAHEASNTERTDIPPRPFHIQNVQATSISLLPMESDEVPGTTLPDEVRLGHLPSGQGLHNYLMHGAAG